MSWTCHEHGEAWRRSSPVSAKNHDGDGDIPIATLTTLSSCPQPLANSKLSEISGEFCEENSEENAKETSRAREVSAGFSAEGADLSGAAAGVAAGCKGIEKPAGDVTIAAAPGDERKGGGGGKGVGLGLFSKIKGKFARHSASARSGVDRKKSESGA